MGKGEGGIRSGPPHYEEGIRACCLEVETKKRWCVHGVILPAYRGRKETKGKGTGRDEKEGKKRREGDNCVE